MLTKKTPLILPSPAKINRFLYIHNKRPDGYHNLQTLFQFINYEDVLTFYPHDSLELISSNPTLHSKNNLVIKAAQLLKKTTGTSQGAKILLNKKLPIGGGLGGGSSNAATTLLGLNHLWKLSLPLEKLIELSRQLGADVPIFVQGESAFAEGIGDILTPVTPKELWFLFLVPDVQSHTAYMYHHPQLSINNKARIDIKEALNHPPYNDFQRLACSLYPAIQQAFTLLNACPIKKQHPPLMSGSGASIFTAYSSFKEAQLAQKHLPKHMNHFIAQGMNTSSLHKALLLEDKKL